MTPANILNIPQRYTDVSGACKYTCLSRRTLDRAKDTGELPFYKYGKKVLFAIADLDAWLAPRRVDVREDVARMDGRADA